MSDTIIVIGWAFVNLYCALTQKHKLGIDRLGGILYSYLVTFFSTMRF